MTSSKEKIKKIIHEGTNEEKRALFAFDVKDTVERIYKKYVLFTRSQYPRYFQTKSAPFHKEMVINEIKAYMGQQNYLNIGFRGSSKTTGKKLFIVFAILNDQNHRRKYMKVMTRDLKNAKQIVTDVFNLIIEVQDLYGNIFEQKTDKKTEKTMSSFTTIDAVKFTAGTVGQTQRGHIQDAYRPDFIWFDDIEDRESIQSDVITNSIINRVDEAIQGLSFDGNWTCTANYISDIGVISNIMGKAVTTQITPILDDNDKPTWERYTAEKIEAIKKDAEDWWGEYMCVKPDTMILTKKGSVKIEDIKVGDLVKTHTGEYKNVLKVFQNKKDDLIDITVNNKTLTITKNHPVYSYRDGDYCWVKAGELKLDDLVIVIPHGKLVQ